MLMLDTASWSIYNWPLIKAKCGSPAFELSVSIDVSLHLFFWHLFVQGTIVLITYFVLKSGQARAATTVGLVYKL